MVVTQGKLLGLMAVILTASAVMTAYAMLYAAAWSIDLGSIVFILWALSPYACFFAASRLMVKLSPASKIGFPGVVIALLMLAFTAYAYLGTMGDPSSTYALIFVFVPLYLYIGSFFLLSLAILLSRFFRNKVS